MFELLKNVEDFNGKLSHVFIDEEKIIQFTTAIHEKDLKVSEISLIHYEWSKEQLLDLVFICNSINFCFWAQKNQPKWTMTFGQEKLDGSAALFRALEEAVRKNDKFTKGSSLAKLDTAALANILKGNVEIPLFEERLKIVNEIGQVLEDRYNGSFFSLFEMCGNDAIKLISSIIAAFPSFFDEEQYNGKSIPFYKRAQLTIKMISDTLIAYGEKPLEGLDQLTAFADYKIPQILRSFGVLVYKTTLAAKIDNFIPITKGSVEEVEIRLATILAVKKMKQHLHMRFDWVTSSHIDSMLWNSSQDRKIKVKPYHRTYTTAY